MSDSALSPSEHGLASPPATEPELPLLIADRQCAQLCGVSRSILPSRFAAEAAS